MKHEVLSNPPAAGVPHWCVEVTDTFGGVANYAWVVRKFVVNFDGSDAALVRVVKRALGISGFPCRRDDTGDAICLKPRGGGFVVWMWWAGDD